MNKNLIYSALECPDGTILESKNRHDYVEHLDSNGERYMLDGGIDYIRTSVNTIPAKYITLYDDAPHEQIREVISRGGRGISGTEPLTYVLLKNIDDSWLKAIIEYETQHRPTNRFLPIYKNEQKFRQL